MNILFTFLIIIIIAYIFGCVLVNLIDNRLSKIVINERFESKNYTEVKEIPNPPIISTPPTISTPPIYSKNNFNGYSNKDNKSYKEWIIEHKKTQVCNKNHKHGTDSNCTYGLTNYADPKDMSPIDFKIFHLNYPNNMTLQDYINWLNCYIDKEDELPYNHLKNLEKIKNGMELIEEHGVLPPPSYYYPALSSENYFEKMYNEVNEFNIAGPLNSVTGPMIGYNYDQYSEFSQNLDMNGSSGVIREPNIAIKKNAKKLYDYINPKDSNSININKEYEIYHIKNNEV